MLPSNRVAYAIHVYVCVCVCVCVCGGGGVRRRVSKTICAKEKDNGAPALTKVPSTAVAKIKSANSGSTIRTF